MSRQQEKTNGENNESQPIEGGLVTQADEDLSFHKEKHQADTARRLAYWLVVVLGASIAMHYATVLTLELNAHHSAVESLEKIYNSWLPVISGLVGGAATYYFTKGK